MKKIILFLIGVFIFTCVNYVNAGSYEIKDGKVFYNSIDEVVGADAETFVDLNGNFSKDKDGVYCGITKMEEANADEVEMVSYIYTKDKENVYYCDRNYSDYEVIEGADPETFNVVDDFYYAKDENKVYYESCWNYYCELKITDINPINLQVLMASIAKNDEFVYINSIKFEEADAQTFEILNDLYARDKNNIYKINYYRGAQDLNIIEGADSESFEILQENKSYAMDKNNMYYAGEIIGEEAHEIENFAFYNNLKGRIILRVEENGEAYYVHPSKNKIFFLSKPVIAFHVMREQGVGITNSDLEKIPVANSYCPSYSSNCDKPEKYDNSFITNQKGKIFLQVEENGEAWYINPEDGKRYFLGRPTDAFNIMRSLGLGISNSNFERLVK